MFYEVKGYALEESVRSPPPPSLTGDTDLTAQADRSDRLPGRNPASTIVHSKNDKDGVDDWRAPLINYLQDPKSLVDRKI